jgi:hypothetical protein
MHYHDDGDAESLVACEIPWNERQLLLITLLKALPESTYNVYTSYISFTIIAVAFRSLLTAAV